MAEERFTSHPSNNPGPIQATPPVPTPGPAPSPHLPAPQPSNRFWSFVITTAVQLLLGVMLGVLVFVLLTVFGAEGRSARGWGLVMGIVGFLALRSLVPTHLTEAGNTLRPVGTETPPTAPPPSELVLLLRWCAGIILTVTAGWVLFAIALFLTRHDRQQLKLALIATAAVSLVLFLLMERGFWLSRLMGLRVGPYTPWWASGLFYWLFGLFGIFFRSTHPEKSTSRDALSGANVRPAETAGREVVETVVFVVVLVLLLKSFAAEAFVIPTGSMAETLYGYQKIVPCPSCGIEFPVNCSRQVDPQDGGVQLPVNGCTCPNCRQSIRMVVGRAPRPGRQLDGTNEYVEITDPGWSSGDRVLVGKFLYDASLPGVSKPERLDVVVFKYPEGPQKNHVAMNYIKRLVGKPGETIAISGGDLYVLPPEKSPPYNNGVSAEPKDLWKAEFMHQNDERALTLFQQGNSFQIVRKPPRILLSMMRLVYDNDHQPEDLKKEKVYRRWEPKGEAWEEIDFGKGFRHGSRTDTSETSWLRYKHRLRDKAGRESLITDFLGYNTGESLEYDPSTGRWGFERHPRDRTGVNWVGDLILECDVKVEKTEGQLILELVRSGERFQASWDLGSADGSCTLSRVADGKKEVLATRPTPLRKGTARLRFANVDHRLTLWVDNALPFDEGVGYTPGSTVGPTTLDRDEPASIGVKGSAVAVQKLKLFRDSYFTLEPNSGDVHIDDWGNPDSWGRLRSPPVKTLHVQPQHYLCLGDNSLASSDGRSWGLVPERLLLGRALLVYYPFNRAGRIR